MDGIMHILESGEFWVAVSFILFMALIFWKAWGPMMRGLDSRADKIREELDEAQRLREEAQHILAETQRKQRDAVKEAEDMLKAAEEEAGRIREKAAEDLKAALKRREQQAMDRIAQAEANAQAEVRGMAADMAVAAARKILTEKLDKKTADSLVDDTIKSIPDKLH
jgi:F-type H+-transporting ATPase subunit b